MKENKNGKTFSNQKFEFQREDYKYSEFSSTLLIPECYLQMFQLKCKAYGGTREYVTYLLSKYQIFITNGLVPGYSNVTTKYQEAGQNLHKIAFRPNPEDWAELKLYRISFGMSISAFLVYLLIADFVEFEKAASSYLVTVGIPVISNFDLSTKVILSNNRSYYTIIFRYRKNRYS